MTRIKWGIWIAKKQRPKLTWSCSKLKRIRRSLDLYSSRARDRLEIGGAPNTHRIYSSGE